MKIKKYLFVLFSVLLTFNAYAIPYNNGKQYITLEKVVGHQNEVVEFFSFFCEKCYEINAVNHMIDKLKKQLQNNVKIKIYHIDSLGGDFGIILTHAWAVALALHVTNKVMIPIFNGIYKSKLITDSETLKNVFIKAAGISSKKYDLTWNSYSVDILIKKQKEALANSYIKNIPATFVNGKYMINNLELNTSSMKSYTKHYIKLVKFLINKK